MADIYIRQLVEWMNQHRNEENAKAMKKYMRDQFDFLGIEQCLALFVKEVGQQIGASRTTTRRYLEYLVSISLVTADISYGSVGRPERIYQIKE